MFRKILHFLRKLLILILIYVLGKRPLLSPSLASDSGQIYSLSGFNVESRGIQLLVLLTFCLVLFSHLFSRSLFFLFLALLFFVGISHNIVVTLKGKESNSSRLVFLTSNRPYLFKEGKTPNSSHETLMTLWPSKKLQLQI